MYWCEDLKKNYLQGVGFRAVNTVNSMEIKRYKNSRTFLGAGKKVSIRKPNDSPNVHK